MRLLYCYIQFLDKNGEPSAYRGLDDIELNLSTVDKCSYNSQTHILCRRDRKTPLPKHFWNVGTKKKAGAENTNIYNINAIAGENGSGKTTVMHCVIDLLDGLHAAIDPDASGKNRMEELGVAANRAILLFEENDTPYLLHYAPHALRDVQDGESRGLHVEGFAQNLRMYECGSWQEFAKTQDEAGQAIAELLRKTKIVYLTNTLSQHDYERHVGERNERLRDFFVYDASIGSTIGPDIAQFFPYEKYKQVKYVFDKDQKGKRDALKDDLRELTLPTALRLHLRMELEREAFSQGNAQTDEPDSAGILQENDRREENLPNKLGRLCVAAYARNVRIRARDARFHLVPKSTTAPVHELVSDTLKEKLEYLEKQFVLFMNSRLLLDDQRPISSVCFSPDGKTVVSGSVNGAVRLLDVSSGAVLETMRNDAGVVCSVCFSPDGETVAGGLIDGTVSLRDARSGEGLATMNGHANRVDSVCFSPDGRIVASGSADETVRLWDASSGDELMVMGGYLGAAINSVCFSPDGRTVVSGSGDGTVRLWDADSGKKLLSMAVPDSGVALMPMRGYTRTVKLVNTGAVNCVCFSPDGETVASGSADGTVRLWDARSGDELSAMHGNTGAVNCVCFSPDGRTVASGSADGTVRLWDARSGEELALMCGYLGTAINSVCFSPDGRTVASGSDDGTVRLWDITDAKPPQYADAIDFASRLRKRCEEYIEFVFQENESLFSRFRQIDEKTYVLSLEDLQTTNQDNGTQKARQLDSLYADLITFMQKYRYTCEPTYTIDFDWGLSSGEENMLRIFSNLYHIFDRDYSSGRYGDYKIYNNERHSSDDEQKTPCGTVLLFMDEADLTLHPEWQRRLICILATFIPQIYPPSCAKDTQLILSTHSPLILGDIPGENITYLPRKDDKSKEENAAPTPGPGETFGQNIHTILKESFFLGNGTVGDFAARRINALAKRLKEIGGSTSNEPKPNEQSPVSSLEDELREIQQFIQIVAPGVLRAKLELLYRDAYATVKLLKDAESGPSAEKVLSVVQALSEEERQWVLEKLQKGHDADD